MNHLPIPSPPSDPCPPPYGEGGEFPPPHAKISMDSPDSQWKACEDWSKCSWPCLCEHGNVFLLWLFCSGWLLDQQITGETRNNKLKIKTASHLFLFAIVVKEKALKRKLDNNSTVSGKIKSLVNISQSIPLVFVPIISTDRPDTVYMYRLSFCTNKKH